MTATQRRGNTTTMMTGGATRRNGAAGRANAAVRVRIATIASGGLASTAASGTTRTRSRMMRKSRAAASGTRRTSGSAMTGTAPATKRRGSGAKTGATSGTRSAGSARWQSSQRRASCDADSACPGEAVFPPFSPSRAPLCPSSALSHAACRCHPLEWDGIDGRAGQGTMDDPSLLQPSHPSSPLAASRGNIAALNSARCQPPSPRSSDRNEAPEERGKGPVAGLLWVPPPFPHPHGAVFFARLAELLFSGVLGKV
mmetsp:Transcript_14734/g.41482  ORF Transcript_14734/g.41482 Transcript_14734/m.41482 type:complete len:256 (-) Transcript_14734:13-780(-)